MDEQRETGYLSHRGIRLKVEMNGPAVSGISFEGPGKDHPAISPLMASTLEHLREYLAGTRKECTLPVEIRGTEFQRAVWDALRQIPRGETRSYGEIARQINRPLAARAVGQAAHRNPLPVIIPCHRLVGAKGQLTGFAGGLGIKRLLLELEREG